MSPDSSALRPSIASSIVSTLISLERRRVRGLDGLGAVPRRDQEDVGTRIAGAGDLLLDAADLADRATAASIVPVPATNRPPVRDAGVSLS